MSLHVQFLGKTARYAMAATTALADLGPGERLPSAALADRTGVPRAFLGKVLTQLSREGLVDGVKGHGGGYRLARDPSEIRLVEILDALSDDDGEAEPRPCALGATPCDEDNPCALHDRWLAIQASLMGMLDEVTVAEAAHQRGPILEPIAAR